MRHIYPDMYFTLVQFVPPEEAVRMLEVANATKEGPWVGDTKSPSNFCLWSEQGVHAETWVTVGQLYSEVANG